MSEEKRSFLDMSQEEIAQKMNRIKEDMAKVSDPVRYIREDIFEMTASILKSELIRKWNLPKEIPIPKPSPGMPPGKLYPPKDSPLYAFLMGKIPEEEKGERCWIPPMPTVKAFHALEIIQRSRWIVDVVDAVNSVECVKAMETALSQMLYVVGHASELKLKVKWTGGTEGRLGPLNRMILATIKTIMKKDEGVPPKGIGGKRVLDKFRENAEFNVSVGPDEWAELVTDEKGMSFAITDYDEEGESLNFVYKTGKDWSRGQPAPFKNIKTNTSKMKHRVT